MGRCIYHEVCVMNRDASKQTKALRWLEGDVQFLEILKYWRAHLQEKVEV